MTTNRTVPSTPLGRYPQFRLCGQAGTTANSNTISKITSNMMVLLRASGQIPRSEFHHAMARLAPFHCEHRGAQALISDVAQGRRGFCGRPASFGQHFDKTGSAVNVGQAFAPGENAWRERLSYLRPAALLLL